MRTEFMIPSGVSVTTAAAAAPVEISIVVPVHNEATGIEAFLAQLLPVLERLGTTWEVICVNDGSTDATLGLLLEFHRRTPGIKVISLSRNFGMARRVRYRLRHAHAPRWRQLAQAQQRPLLLCDFRPHHGRPDPA
jgi:glycosyltransferase involved in cell wall biosynthesis